MPEQEESVFHFRSKVLEKNDHAYGKILYFPMSYQEMDHKLRKHRLNVGDVLEVTVRLKKQALQESPAETSLPDSNKTETK